MPVDQPTEVLKQARVSLSYQKTNGVGLKWDAKLDLNSRNATTGEPIPVERALLDGLSAIALQCCLLGMEDEAQAQFNKAMAEYRRMQPAS